MSLATGIRIGKYTVGDKLGQGGFGVLYMARDTELDRDIAIKFLRPEHALKAQVVQRFLLEARAAARISHPGIVTVYESGLVSGTSTRADGTVYIAMELLAGSTLAQRIKQAGRLPYGIAIGLCRQMADALAAAHDASIIHRDLKPQNVFLVRDAAVVGGERVKVLDFGIAKLADSFGSGAQTHSHVVMGTPMYMSPEQCRSSAKVDARSDIYSLGCMLFQMLTGRTPFDGDAGELIAKHQLVPPPTVRSLVPELPPPIDALVAAMLAKSPDERPQTMSAVIDVIDAVEDAIAATPPPEPSFAVPDLLGVDTMQETLASNGAGERAPSRTNLSTRGRLLAVGALVLVGSVIGGVAALRDDDPPPATSAAVVAADAATVIAEVEQPDASVVPVAEEPDEPDEPEVVRVVTTPPPKRTGCDFEKLKDRGIEHLNMGRQAAALTAFEQSLKCKDDAYVRQLAFMAACSSKNSARAIAHYPHLTAAQQTKFAQVCERQEPPVAYRKVVCDADALRDKGMASVNQGKHVEALAYFEASYQCGANPSVARLALMEACASNNPAKAKRYYKRTAKDEAAKIAQICVRNGVAYQ